MLQYGNRWVVGKTTKNPPFNFPFLPRKEMEIRTYWLPIFLPPSFVWDSQNEGVYVCMSSELFFVKKNAIWAQADFHALLQIYTVDASDETQRSIV